MNQTLQPTYQPIDYTPEHVYALDQQPPGARRIESFRLEREYLNGLPIPVTVIDRTNLKLTFPPEHLLGVSHFIIRVRLLIRKDIPIDIHGLKAQNDPGLSCFAELVEKGQSFNRFHHVLYGLDYHISQQDLEKNGGSVYLRNLDTVLSVLDRIYAPHHPLSHAGLHTQQLIEHPQVNETSSFGYGIKIVDKHQRFGPRWINLNNRVFKIPVSTDPHCDDGVYLTSSGLVDGDHRYPQPTTQRFRFEQADEALRLYKSAESAHTHGDVFAEKEQRLKEAVMAQKEQEQRLKEREQVIKEAMLERQREAEERKHELEKQRHRLEQERLDEEARRKREEARYQERVSRLKEELADLEHRRKREYIKDRERFERAEHRRKESSEWTKLLPIIATGILSLAAVLFKMK